VKTRAEGRLADAHGGAYNQRSWDDDDWGPQDDKQARPGTGRAPVKAWR
jgi:hypothetical protein